MSIYKEKSLDELSDEELNDYQYLVNILRLLNSHENLNPVPQLEPEMLKSGLVIGKNGYRILRRFLTIESNNKGMP
ncbi:TPA: hypothetical protein O4I98_004728 [Vibrio parahaemolyticus]|nr:hypothetical protein [Vibrio parahaemolyticus]